MTTAVTGHGAAGQPGGGRDVARGNGGGGSRAAVLVHDVSGPVAHSELGTIGDLLEQYRIDAELVTVGAHPYPDPAGLDLVVVMGSDRSAHDDSVPWLSGELSYLRSAVAVGTPVLGICFGGQLLARALGGTVRRGERNEHGWFPVTTVDPEAIPIGPWMEAHFDTFTIPPGAQRLAWTPDAEQAFRLGPHLGLQFHPEITPTVFETWLGFWQARGQDKRLATLGVDLAGLRAEIARRADAARAACYSLFDHFWARARAHLAQRGG
ncbi:MAG: type 1 glutamine amidotransferase [Frankia sp.]|nr:type 1 glutamine amidotransferase [Frankia sp.]